MTCEQHAGLIAAVAVAMRAAGVAHYQADGIVVVLGAPAPQPWEPPRALADDDARAQDERIMFAASEGLR
jgi:hypothetical protein